MIPRPAPAPAWHGRTATRIAVLAAGLVSACVPAPRSTAPQSGGFDFAVVGDTPYSSAHERLFPHLTREIGEADLAFVVHIGDVKGSGAPCSDSLVAARIAALDGFGHPLVYVPGDNEWTDCHRSPPGVYAPLERLAFLRRQAYPGPGMSRGTPPMDVETQATAGFPEHQRWSHGGVVFSTLHVVGSLNGRVGFPTRTPEDDLEVDRRVQASVAWLREAFAQAHGAGAVAVVVAIQANPWDVPPGFAGRTGFEEVLTTLREEAESYAGQVLLIHGDTHTFRVDRPFWSETDPAVPNLMRLETYGAPDVGWVRVRVDPASPAVFGFTPRPIPPQ